MIAGTRAALGAGVALLLADRLNPDQRRAAGWTLLLVGALSTIPLAAEVLFRHEHEESAIPHDGEPASAMESVESYS
jgi:hypothetical protein